MVRRTRTAFSLVGEHARLASILRTINSAHDELNQNHREERTIHPAPTPTPDQNHLMMRPQ